MEANYLFVYGSLRPAAENTSKISGADEARRLLSTYGEFIGTGYIGGRLLNLGCYPGWVPSSDSRVPGDLMRLPEIGSAALLKAMDRYEGCCDAEGIHLDDSEYRRVLVDVETANGIVVAWCYEYVGTPEAGTPVDKNDWLTVINSESY